MRDISVSFAATGAIQVVNIATGLLAARLLLPEGRGELAAIMLWPGILAEIRDKKAISDDLKAKMLSAIKEFKDRFSSDRK